MNPLVPVPRECMTHEQVRETLASCESLSARREAISRLLQRGVPLFQIESTLDWLDAQAQTQPAIDPQPDQIDRSKRYVFSR